MAAGGYGAHSRDSEVHGGAGILVVRLWWESGHAAGLRARVTSRVDAADPAERTSVATERAEIVTIVLDWVDEFVRRHHSLP